MYQMVLTNRGYSSEIFEQKTFQNKTEHQTAKERFDALDALIDVNEKSEDDIFDFDVQNHTTGEA